MTRIPRRRFLGILGLGLATPYVASFGRMRNVLAQASQINAASVFSLSVASGDPSATGVVLWTRIDPLSYQAGEDLYFEVAEDAGFTIQVFEGLVPAMEIGPQRDYTVKIDLNGELQPNRRYYYRFVYRDVASRTGRCRTTPLPGASMSLLKLALVSCQDYTNGYYSVFDHIATDDSIHYVLHLGDFIYETVGDRRFQPLPFADRRITLPNGFGEARDIYDYRHLYRTFRSDPKLQRALEQHTWIFTTDDHETSNNCYWDYERDTLGAPDHPYQKDPAFGNDPALLRMLKLDAQRAWLEYVPARVTVNPGATHPHQFLSTYRSFKFGNLVDLFMLDTRSYRTRQPDDNSIFEHYVPASSPGLAASSLTMLGQTQREWLYNGLHAATARWQVLGNQTFFSKLEVAVAGQPLFANSDAWDGYYTERTQLVQQVHDAGIDNFAVLTGDMHSYIASHIERNFNDGLSPSNVAGIEFMTPSVTSGNISDVLASLDAAQAKGDLSPQALTYKQILQALLSSAIYVTNTHLHYFNSYKYGYSIIKFAHDRCDWTGYSVSKNVATGTATRSIQQKVTKFTDLPYLVPTPSWP
jgi:alkaline phosphatase D